MISTAASASLADLSAHDLLAGYRRRAFSPVEVAQAVLARIEQWEPHIAATWLLRPEQALAQARASEARWLQGAPQGLLDGVPVTIKDNVATEGDPTPLGTRAVATSPAAADAPPAAR
ncbi:MAG: amidase, partial [Ottowia sp.]|nr:amidase [Ottowia sp.]